jgi:hypothetical protein
MLGVRQACVSIDLRQHLAAPEVVEATDPGPDLELITRLPDVREIKPKAHQRSRSPLDGGFVMKDFDPGWGESVVCGCCTISLLGPTT